MQGLRYYNGHVVPKRLVAKPIRESRCASFKVEAVHFLWSFRCRLVDRCRSVAESDASRALWVRPLRIGSTVLVCFRRSVPLRQFGFSRMQLDHRAQHAQCRLLGDAHAHGSEEAKVSGWHRRHSRPVELVRLLRPLVSDRCNVRRPPAVLLQRCSSHLSARDFGRVQTHKHTFDHSGTA